LDGNTIVWITGIASFVIGAALRICRNKRSQMGRIGTQEPASIKRVTQAPVFCTHCGTKLELNDVFCNECGKRLTAPREAAAIPVLIPPERPTAKFRPSTPPPPSRFCISCGAKIPADSKFCPRCASKQG
jgi:predicted amidophosphoribosyltransferase